MTFRQGMGQVAICLGIGLALVAWGAASAVIVPVDHLYRRVRGGDRGD